MNAVEFLKVKARMCRAYNCNKCDLYHAAHMEDHSGCTGFEKEFPEKAVEIVERWARENPAKTRQSEFLKLFPNAKVSENGVIAIDPCVIDAKFSCPFNDRLSCCEQCRETYWSEEVEDGED